MQRDWSNERLLPRFPAPKHLEIYDIRGTSLDTQLSIATAVGLINRSQPQIYLLIRKDDLFWLQTCLKALPHNHSPLRNENILFSRLKHYRSPIEGLIIYDPPSRDSINIAPMLAAQHNGIVASPSLVEQLQEGGFRLPILSDLRTFRWQSRTQAYQWAYEQLLPSASSMIVTGLNPNSAATLRPFLVASNSFIYWLDPRNILPDLKAGGISEACLMHKILRAFPAGTAHLGWFIDEGVGTTFASLSAHPVLASDYLSNMEIWASVPVSSSSEPVPAQKITPPQLDTRKIYISFTISEGDNLQYNQERLLNLWQDPARGNIPIGWTISPALIEAAPTIANYFRETATEKDALIAGPSGAGYMYPSFWPSSQLPFFLKRTGRLMQEMMIETLEVLDANILQNLPLALRAFFFGSGMALIDREKQHLFAQNLSAFDVKGILSGGGQKRASWKTVSDLPIYQNAGIVNSDDVTLSYIRACTHSVPRPYFLNLYVVAWTMTPSDLQQVTRALSDEYEIVTPVTLLTFLKEYN